MSDGCLYHMQKYYIFSVFQFLILILSLVILISVYFTHKTKIQEMCNFIDLKLISFFLSCVCVTDNIFYFG